MKNLIAIQQELKAPKDKYNSFGGFSYRSAEGIMEEVKPLLAKYGCIIMLSDSAVVLDGWHYIKSTAIFKDKEWQTSVEALAREPETKKGMDAPQISGTASSYARKYALSGLLMIDDNKDADTDEYVKQTEGAAKSKKTSKSIAEPAVTSSQEDLASPEQIRELHDLMDDAQWKAMIANKGSSDTWTAKEVSSWIVQMKERKNK